LAIDALLGVVSQSAEFAQIRDGLARARSEQLVSGLSGSQKSLYVAALFRSISLRRGMPLLVVTHSSWEADRLRTDLLSLLPPDQVQLFPALETLPHEEVSRSVELTRERLTVLDSITTGKSVLVVASVQALSERILPSSQLFGRAVEIDMDSRVDLADFGGRLVQLGYERVDRVDAPGHFSIRGGIIDVFPFSLPQPVRLELFDDEVDSIRFFSLANQRSTEKIAKVRIPPAREFLYPESDRMAALESIEATAVTQVAKLRRLGHVTAAESLCKRVDTHLEKLSEGVFFEGMDQFKPFFHQALCTLVEYFPDDAPVIVDEPSRTAEHARAFENETGERQGLLLEKGRTLPTEANLYASWPDLLHSMRRHPTLFMSGLLKRTPGVDPVRVIQIASRTPDIYHGRLDRLAAEVKAWRRARLHICLVLSTPERGARVVEAFKDEGVEALFVPEMNGELKRGNVVVTLGQLTSGGELPSSGLVLLTDNEVFGREKRRRRVRGDEPRGTRIAGFGDLKIGDYVVHDNHGIGRYLGVDTLSIGGVHKDYLVVQYQGEDKLFVPTDQVNLLQRYVGVEGHPPKLYKLGGTEWTRVKKRVKESVQEMAQGLLRLYAEREAISGYAFSPDTVWQQQFEDAFPFQETPDQLRAIQEVKADMEQSRPMDRLLCGDVGYGKTEVAIRAAFKAVMDGKQVAVLVPTTILAQQHGRTFQERFNGYPIKIRVLSRFQSAAEQTAIIKGLAKGDIDIVIGTHRLLSKDVVFRDLGFVVVDEEQRFGVAQKERLKEITKKVDVLTLTATPIPRTLHMSMVGVRDMSVIETPPEDRFPIRTYVVEHDEDMVREAVMREMVRDGQVYFVYNRVQNIDNMAMRLSTVVPEARIAVAHGQMDEEELEQIMLEFLDGQYDVLLCSTIIETGMDISNVNTLIVYDADHLGLAQLYQLRGRVGRSNRVAYAYFTYKRDKVLSEDAEKRLSAIKEFTELGSGFRIALRDLEIRGAGNILGPEQHGFIATIGFELYCKLLEESVKELRGELVSLPPEPVIDLTVDAYVPDSYVPDSQQKVEIYKKVVTLRNQKDVQELEEEIEDRFGDLPQAVRNLLSVARIKDFARNLGVSAIAVERDGVVLKLHTGLTIPRDVANHLTRRFRGRLVVLPSRANNVKLRSRGLTDPQLLAFIEEVLNEMYLAWHVAPAAREAALVNNR
jgi:transcription-repair coupling factor (superfamily II helicase)